MGGNGTQASDARGDMPTVGMVAPQTPRACTPLLNTMTTFRTVAVLAAIATLTSVAAAQMGYLGWKNNYYRDVGSR